MSNLICLIIGRAEEQETKLSEEENISPCLCGTLPVKEMRSVMLGKLADGGYPVVQGRFRCPNCGLYPSWGMSYSVFGGRWDENIAVWNKFIQKQEAKRWVT